MSALKNKAEPDSANSLIPPSFTGDLHRHQLIALNWLFLLHSNKVNGILADEMGLGKTISCIAFLALLEHLKKSSAPHLVIVPSSTIANWETEFSRFCPSLKVFVYYGSMDDRRYLQSKIKKLKRRNALPSVFITTYSLVVQKFDQKFFSRFSFDYLVLDEAQGIKNASSIRHQRITAIKCYHRLLLTGTPIQNNLRELWSLLSFLMPSVFNGFNIEDLPLDEVDPKHGGDSGDEQEGKEEEKEGEKVEEKEESEVEDSAIIQKKERRRAQLRRILAPFILRRLKKSVLPFLPEKTEELIYCQRTEVQDKVYTMIVNRTRTELMNNVTNQKTMSNIVMQLRKASNHPHFFNVFYNQNLLSKISKILDNLSLEDLKAVDRSLFFPFAKKSKPDYEEILFALSTLTDLELHYLCSRVDELEDFEMSNDELLWSSSKILKLREIVPTLVLQGHRILIFSQFVMVLDVLERLFSEIEMDYCRLDGSTPTLERQEIIDSFNQNESIKIFLLSTKAGGVGINLTAADTVIFFDCDWNPQNDSQAEDRVHRIGQTKQVKVFKLILKDSIDEFIYETARKKAILNAELLDNAFVDKKMERRVDFAKVLEAVLFKS
ncbi:hypothetical protein RCL1_002095 [Eukaryota sp. TZLM3-RCL]